MTSFKETLGLPPGRAGAVWLMQRGLRGWPEHRHDELELNLVLRGRCVYLVDGRRVELGRDRLLLLFPEQDHVVVEDSPDAAMWVAVFRPALIRRTAARRPFDLAAGRPAGEQCWRLEPGRVRALDGLCRAVLGAGSGAAANAALAALLLAARDALVASPASAAGAAVHPAVAAAALRVRASPDLDGAALARAVGLSRSRLSRRFHAEIGVTLAAYRNRVRLERALDALRDGERNLLRAALGAGFGSYAQFHRVVKASLGCAPRDLLERG